MSKFGDLIEGEKPILLAFYDGVENEEDSIQPLLLDVAKAIADGGKVIKLDISKNPKLVEALKIRPLLLLQFTNHQKWYGEKPVNKIKIHLLD